MNSIKVVTLVLLLAASTYATTVSGRFVLLTNDGSTYSVLVQLKTDDGEGLGGTTLKLTYDNSYLSFPTSPVAPTNYSYAAFTSGSYSPGLINVDGNILTISIEYNGADGAGTPVETEFMDVVTINFTTLNPSGHSNLHWTQKEVVGDDYNQWANGTFMDLDTNPLPVELTSLVASYASQGTSVLLRWSTASEVNNYGYDVQRSKEEREGFTTLNGSFQSGHGTTLEAHTYSFLDKTAISTEPWYRLAQRDLNGAVHYSEPANANGTTGVDAEIAPKEFALYQNFPNPFNPTTTIRFTVEKSGPTTLVVYNLVGQVVARLFDGMAVAGRYQTVKLDAGRFASGMYLYRLQSGDKVQVRKLMLLK